MILDQPTAARDPEAEQAVYEQCGRTARELGTHHEPLAAGGHYSELFGMPAHAYR